MDKYIEQAARTKADTIHANLASGVGLRKMLINMFECAEILDGFKRELFYGIDNSHYKSVENSCDTYHNNVKAQFFNEQDAIDFQHGIIGTLTESGELADPLLTAIGGDKFDPVNAIEEVGDTLWYLALVLSALGCTFDDAMTLNIKKLKARYPLKFDKELTLKRDTKKELEEFRQLVLTKVAKKVKL